MKGASVLDEPCAKLSREPRQGSNGRVGGRLSRRMVERRAVGGDCHGRAKASGRREQGHRSVVFLITSPNGSPPAVQRQWPGGGGGCGADF